MKTSTLLAALYYASLGFSVPLERSQAPDVTTKEDVAKLDKRALNYYDIVISAGCVSIRTQSWMRDDFA
jgi:hypothetical protein